VVSSNVRRQHLEGDVAPEPRIGRAIDLAHPAAANQRQDFVSAEASAEREGHRLSGFRECYTGDALAANNSPPPLHLAPARRLEQNPGPVTAE